MVDNPQLRRPPGGILPAAFPAAGEEGSFVDADAPPRKSRFARAIPGAVRNVLTSIVVGTMIAGLVWYFDRQDSGATSAAVTLTAEASGPAPKVGMPAPDFRLVGLDGNPIQLSELRGHPVWLTFWATWCPPCRAENPDIQAVYTDKKANGLVVVAVNIGEEPGTVRGYAERTGLSFSIVLDAATEVASMYRSAGIPTHFFIDADGVIRDWRIGTMSKKAMESKVESILTASAPQAGRR